jgi:hypothetical protein
MKKRRTLGVSWLSLVEREIADLFARDDFVVF